MEEYTENGTSPTERCMLQTAKLEGQIHLITLKLKAQIPAVEVQDFLFCPDGFQY